MGTFTGTVVVFNLVNLTDEPTLATAEPGELGHQDAITSLNWTDRGINQLRSICVKKTTWYTGSGLDGKF